MADDFYEHDGERVLSRGRESGNLAAYLDANPLINRDEIVGAAFQFRIPGNPVLAHGYEATVLIDDR